MDNARVLNALLMTPGPRGFWGLTPNLIGKPGTAKTSSLEAAARRAGLPFKTIILSMRRPEDQLGLPFIRPEGKGVGFEPPDWVRWCQQVGRALIIFDEINTCEAPTQASCLRIMAERVVGDVELPRGIRFATAMNAVEDAAGGHDMASSFANRVGHWAWDSGGVQPFLIYMLSRGGRAAPEETAADPAKAEAQVMEKWDPFWTSACGIVAGFLQRRPDLLSKPPPAHDPASSGPWPSNRTWEMAALALAGAKLHGLDETEIEHVVTMFIGGGAAGELLTWMANTDLPDPAAVLDGKVKWAHDPERIDITAAVISSCAALATSPQCERQEARIKSMWKLLQPLTQSVIDQVIPAATTLVEARFSGGKWGDFSDPVLSSVSPAMRAAGLLR